MLLKSNRSFSLIEVLITVGILSSAIIFVFRSFTASLIAVNFSQNTSLACYLSENKIWEISQAYKNNLDVIPGSGNETVANKNFEWQYELLETDFSDIEQFQFAVSWARGNKKQNYRIEFLTYFLK